MKHARFEKLVAEAKKSIQEISPQETAAALDRGDTLLIERVDDSRDNRSLHGLQRSLIANMVTGVSDGFSKDLEIVGLGGDAC